MKNQRGESTLTTVVVIFLAAVLMFLFPMIAIGQKNDDASGMYVHEQLQNFVDKAALSGKISKADYEQLQSALAATNNSYDIEISIKISDINAAIKSATQNKGEASYYTLFDKQVKDELQKNGVIILKENDYITVIAKNTNQTIAQSIRNILYGIVGKNDVAIAEQVSAYVTVTGSN